MKNDIYPEDHKTVQNNRLLVCDMTGNVDGVFSSDTERVIGPIACFSQAVEGHPKDIVIHFGRIPIRDRELLVELAAGLRQNRHTRDCRIVVLVHTWHRQLVDDLKRAQVDFIRYLGDAGPDAIRVADIVETLGEEDRLERHLEKLCPFLHYSRIDPESEMTVCGAYLDRLVLGGRRLHELCETGDHLVCENFRNPRCGS